MNLTVVDDTWDSESCPRKTTFVNSLQTRTYYTRSPQSLEDTSDDPTTVLADPFEQTNSERTGDNYQ